MIKRAADITYKTAKRLVIAVVGSSVLILGLIMLVTPGPALLVIPAGLGILAIEFVWARRWLKKMRVMISRRAAEMRAAGVNQHINH
jgi:tellurite resistance protein TerC